jgi:hypothetical protein
MTLKDYKIDDNAICKSVMVITLILPPMVG